MSPGAERRQQRQRFRSVAAWTLALVACLAIPLSVVAWWGVTTLVNENRYVAALAPLAHNKAVTSAVTDDVTTALLSQAARSPVPLPTAQLRPALRSAAAQVVDGPSFPPVWTSAVKASHPAVLTLLRGSTTSTTPVTLDLSPVVSAVVAELAGSRLASLDPALAASSPHVVVTVVPTTGVRTARQVFHVLTTLQWVLPAIAAVALVGAVLLAPRRRAVLVGLGTGTAAASLVVVGLVAGARQGWIDDLHASSSARVASAVIDGVAGSLRVDLYVTTALAAVLALATAAWWAATTRARRSAARA